MIIHLATDHAGYLHKEAVKKYIVRYSLNHEENDHASILADSAIPGGCLNGILDNDPDVDYLALCEVEV